MMWLCSTSAGTRAAYNSTRHIHIDKRPCANYWHK